MPGNLNVEPPVPAAAAAPALPPENLVRGLLLTLLIIPAGVFVFSLLWSVGFISALVGFGVAFGAYFLYRLGSGGRVSMPGAIVVTVVTVVTLVLAFLIAIAADVAHITHVSIPEALFGPHLASAIGANALNALITVGFGVLGCFTVLRNAFREARAATTPPATPVA
jgi:hypothetical protein